MFSFQSAAVCPTQQQSCGSTATKKQVHFCEERSEGSGIVENKGGPAEEEEEKTAAIVKMPEYDEDPTVTVRNPADLNEGEGENRIEKEKKVTKVKMSVYKISK